MSGDQKAEAVTSLFGSDVPSGDFKQTLQAPAASSQGSPDSSQGLAQPKDLFTDQGVQPPDVATQNAAALNSGIVLNTAMQSDTVTPSPEIAPPAPMPNNAPIGRGAMSMPPGNTPLGADTTTSAKEQAAYDQAQIMKLANSRFSPQQIKDWQNSPITFTEAFQKLHPNQYIPGGGVSQAANALAVKSIADKLQNGEQITPEDKTTLNDYLNEEIEKRVRGYSWGGKVAYVGSQIPAFVVEFALSDGYGKLAQTAVKEAAIDAGVHSALSSAIGATTRVATTTALMPAQVVEKYGERRLNDAITITDKGEAILTPSKESPAYSAALAFAHTSADVAGQLTAPLVGKFIVQPAGSLLKTPLVAAANQLPAATKEALYNAYKLIKPNAKVSDVLSAAGWQGMIEQLGANRVTQILNSSLDFADDKNMTTDQYLAALTPTKDQLYLEGGLIGIAGAASSATHLTANLMKSKGIPEAQAHDTVVNMSEMEKEQYVRDNLPMPKSGYPELGGTLPEIPLEAPTRLEKFQNISERLGDQYTVNDDQGRGVGSITYRALDDGSIVVSRAVSNAEDKGQGHFSNAYKQLADKAIDAGGSLQSDSEVSADARRLYDSLKKSGYEVVKASDAKVADDGSISVKKGPVFSVVSRPATLADMLPDQRSSVLFDRDIARTQTASAEVKEPPPINDEESTFNYLNRALFNDKAAAEEPFNRAVKAGFTPAKMDNTPLLMSLNHQTPELVRSHLMVNTFKWDENGNIINTGKSMKAILDDFDNMFVKTEPNFETRRADFEDYLVARHYLSLEKTAPEVTVTPEQKQKSIADMTKIADKYGDDSKFFNTLGDEFVAFRNRTRDLLVGTLLTEKQRAAEREKYPYSIPLQRELDAAQHEAGIARGDYAGLNPGNLTKGLKGSALPVKDIFHSTFRETARVMDFVQRNRVNASIAHLKEYMPEGVQETSIPIVKKGTAEFTQYYDGKLRAKLDAAIEFLDGKVERSEIIKGGKEIGSYSPMENLIRLKLGATDGTRAHELGHMLDEKVGLGKELLKDPEAKKQLKELALDRLGGEHELAETAEGVRFTEERNKAPDKYMRYLQNDQEIIANFFDAYVHSPEQVKRIAPKALEAFDDFIDKNPRLEFLREIKPSTSRESETVQKDIFGHGDLPKNTFAYWENAQKKYIKVSKPMFESLSSMRPSQISAAGKFFYNTLRILSFARPLTIGATNTPEFILRNPVRDTLEATVQSGVKYNPTYIPRAMYGMINRSRSFEEFKQAGGKFASFMALDDGGIEEAFHQLLTPKSSLAKSLVSPKAWLENYEKIPKASETLTRYGVYLAAIDHGMAPIEAANAALDATLNFPRGGFATRKANQFMPFLNVGFLATEKLVRAFKADPTSMVLRGVSYLTLPSLLVSGYYLYGADEQTRKEWQELPEEQIAAGRVFFKFNGEWRYIPTPYALGYMFSGVPMLTLRAIHGDNPDDGKALWETLMKGALGAVSPINDYSSLIPPAIKTFLEDIQNFDFFRNRPIYSKFKEGDGVMQKDKTNSYDSETAKLIGNHTNTSPALIDHTLYGLFGSTAGYVLGATDRGIKAVRAADGQQVPQDPRTGADRPLEKAFTVRQPEGTRSNSYQGFQKHYLDAMAIANHVNQLEGADKASYLQENGKDISRFTGTNKKGNMTAASYLTDAHKQIQANMKQISQIYNDPHMASEDKTSRIATIEKQITRIAGNANKQYNAVTKAGK